MRHVSRIGRARRATCLFGNGLSIAYNDALRIRDLTKRLLDEFAAPLGVIMVLTATACYGVATNMAGPLQHRYGSVRLMVLMLGLGALWATPFGLVGAADSGWSLGPIIAPVVLGVLGTGLAFVLMATLVGRVGGPRASFITYLIPLVALVMGAAFLGETVTPVALVGAAMVLAASILASRSEA
jgi:drug/metabolite transporter (DMT)-like permease